MMSTRAASATGPAGRIALIVAAIALLSTAVLALDRALTRRAAAAPAEFTIVAVAGAAIAIESEAAVFRANYVAAELTLPRRPAHRRTLATYRALRAYPGAPPTIPHGLAANELRSDVCLACHERGGFSQRFGAYAPVTPHADYSECLQCHVIDDALTGVSLPGPRPNAGCLQCHVTSGLTAPRVALDWDSPWRDTAPRTGVADGAPPVIPHELQLRGDCNACHAGPAAVAEIRTAHPERTNCRQCHVTAEPDVEVFSRPLRGDGS